MKQDEIRKAVLTVIRRVASKVGTVEIDPALGVEIPDKDDPLVTTPDGCVSYLDAAPLVRRRGQEG